MRDYLLKKYIETNKELIEKESSLLQDVKITEIIEEEKVLDSVEKYNEALSINNSIEKIDAFLNQENTESLDSFINKPTLTNSVFEEVLFENEKFDSNDEPIDVLIVENKENIEPQTITEKVLNVIEPMFVEDEEVYDFKQSYTDINISDIPLNFFDKLKLKFISRKNKDMLVDITNQSFFGFLRDNSTKIIAINVVESTTCNLHIISKVDANAVVKLIGIYYDSKKDINTTKELLKKVDVELVNNNLSYLLINAPILSFNEKINLFSKITPVFSIYDFAKRCKVTPEIFEKMLKTISDSHSKEDEDNLIQLLNSSIDGIYKNLLNEEIDSLLEITHLPLDERGVLLNIEDDFNYALYLEDRFKNINFATNQIVKNISYLKLNVNKKVFELI